MKNISQFIILVLFITGITVMSVANTGNENTITGNGNVVTQKRTIESFHALKVSGGIDVILTQGIDISLQVEADENLLENIKTEVKNGVLNIYSEKNIRNAKTMQIHLTFNKIDAITASGGCDITSKEKLSFSSLQTDLSGGCDIKLEFKAENLMCKNSGGCDAYFKGEAAECSLNVSGGSDFKGSDFRVTNCKIVASGGSDVYVFVSGTLDAEASGACDVYYSGSPIKVTKRASGGSEIHQK
jgi:hypothetical protein